MGFLIEANHLTKRYGEKTAVEDATFNIGAGEIVGFLGPNGAGKTTTLKMLTGLLPPDEGTALIAGHDIQDEPIVAKQVLAYIPDTPNLYGKLKAIEFLRFMAQLYHVPGEVAEERIKRYLEVFELTDRAGDYLEGFSHGMQQKIAIIGGLIRDVETHYKRGLLALELAGVPQEALDVAQRLADALLVLDQGEAHVALAVLAEAHAGRHGLPRAQRPHLRALRGQAGRVVSQRRAAR